MKKTRRQYNEKYYQSKKEELITKVKDYRAKNKEKVLNYKKLYDESNRDKISKSKKEYARKNKEKIRKYQREYQKARKLNDPEFKFRNYISSYISLALKQQNSSKSSKSSWNMLPYSVTDLIKHLESLFEPWMTLQNYGKYSAQNWDDDNISTWTWQIDHIIPQSTFRYVDMECDDFKKCWDLSNLRPLSSKKNLVDGVSRSRHHKLV